MHHGWKDLLQTAARILDRAGIAPEEWSFGGGTALAFHLNHRISNDVDIFLTDAQLLLLVTPRLNGDVAAVVRDYQEASWFLKLFFGQGVVDLIIAPYLTAPCCTWEKIDGRSMRVETAAEIIAKKLFYRPETLKVRDVVDVAAAAESGAESLVGVCADVLASRVGLLERRWQQLKPAYAQEARGLAVLRPGLVERAPELFEDFLRRLRSGRGSSP
jgi:hypothetical protein